MPKTIAITPSWYWPTGLARVTGVPPFRLDELLVERWARERPDDPALVDGEHRLSGRELAQRVASGAVALHERVSSGGRAILIAGPTVEGAVLLLSLARAGIPTLLIDPRDGQAATLAANFGASLCCVDATGQAAAAATALPVVRGDDLSSDELQGDDPFAGGRDALGVDRSGAIVAVPADGEIAWHSQQSLLGGAVSLQTFFDIDPRRPWLTTLPLSTWAGVYGVAAPLLAGTTVVLAPPGEAALDLIARESVGTSLWDLEDAFVATREAKKQVKNIRGVQERIVLLTGRLFDPDQRRRVGKFFEVPALTLFGLPETGPIFASHPSWYLDESIGIPISNAWVVPVDPRSGNPIPTLWELVESAMVTVWSPSLLVGYEGGAHAERFRDGRFVTGLVASSDANGMIYLLPA